MATIVAVLSNISGATVTLLMLVLLVASAPNSKPQELMTIKWLMTAAAVVGLGCLIGGGWTLVSGKPWTSTGLGLTPVLWNAVVLAVMLVLQR
jgi:hypothetical protein